jgi:hypothetical protein
MVSVRLRFLGSLCVGLAGAGCAMGGQTYDDGSDEVRRNDAETEPEAGANAEPDPGPGEEPEPGPGEEPEPGPGEEPEQTAEPEPPALTCESLSNDVAEQRQAIVEDADTSCETVADCVAVSAAPNCIETCGATALVNESAVGSLQSAIEELDATLCEDFFDAGCEFFASSCPTPGIDFVPACEAGQCVHQEASELSCEDLALEATAAFNAEVAALDLSCSEDADCVVLATSTSCVDACGTLVVGNTTALANGVDALTESACATFDSAGCTYPQPPCPMIDRDTVVTHCYAGQCALGPGPTPAACYSPDRNVDLAYSGEIPGCECGDVGDVCVPPAALICEQGTWLAVEDGPCEPGLIDQGCDGRIDSAVECVELFDTCQQLSTGTYCGIGRRTSLCDAGEMVETQSDCVMDDAFCVELSNGKYCTGGAGSGPIDAAACEGRGGEVFSDPGDGSLDECPDGRATLAQVSGCDEGCLCCGFLPGDEP